jgi:D-glycero-alpha-D-manno-heptose-7-phosphate kinase
MPLSRGTNTNERPDIPCNGAEADAMKNYGTARRVHAVVPNRVDLAGGTLDIYPLYLLVPGSMTVNAAINIRSEVEIVPARGQVTLRSENYSLTARARDTHGFSTEGKMGLIASGLRFFPRVEGISIRVGNEAPIGSGIGASSSLLVALMLAMDALLGKRRRWEETARKAMEIEACYLRRLTGCQDYVAALRGGIQGIRYRPGHLDAERIGAASVTGRRLAAHGFVAGTGISHSSGNVNWRMIRGAIDGNEMILRKFRGIAAAACETWKAASVGDIESMGKAIAGEWKIRRALAPGVSLPAVGKLFASREFRLRVSGAKLCGAGGGGAVFGLLRGPEDREAVERLLAGQGFSVFPFRLSNGPEVELG